MSAPGGTGHSSGKEGFGFWPPIRDIGADARALTLRLGWSNSRGHPGRDVLFPPNGATYEVARFHYPGRRRGGIARRGACAATGTARRGRRRRCLCFGGDPQTCRGGAVPDDAATETYTKPLLAIPATCPESLVPKPTLATKNPGTEKKPRGVRVVPFQTTAWVPLPVPFAPAAVPKLLMLLANPGPRLVGVVPFQMTALVPLAPVSEPATCPALLIARASLEDKVVSGLSGVPGT